MKISNRYLLSVFIATALFILFLVAPIPYAFSAFFGAYSAILFILVFALYSLSFWLKESWHWLLGLSITMALFGLALSAMWTSGFSDNKIIGGLLPYRDAFHYYNGARLILDGRMLSEHSVQAAGKPLFPGFLASLLLVTGKNLQTSIAILVALLGFTSYLSAQKLKKVFGGLPAALYLSLSFLYAQPQIGFLHAELLGLILGNLGFVLIWEVAEKRNLSKLIFAIIMLMLAVSARAGAFFIFPMLALWAGWAFREEKRFSWRSFFIASLVVVLSYFTVNTLYSRFVVEPGNYNFSNFAYTIYGQTHGGTGWNRAIKDLATRDPVIIMDASIQFFKEHPLSLFIGTAKAYRDFFIFGDRGIFNFYGSKIAWLDIGLWVSGIILLLLGLRRSLKMLKAPVSSLLLAGFIGIFLSIPFLPPIDGGSRFYASTMPFFFALISMALSSIGLKKKTEREDDKDIGITLVSGLLALMSLVMPVAILQLTAAPDIATPTCPADQTPYAIRFDPDFYVDIVSSPEMPCGKIPSICFDDFSQNSTEKNNNPFFQEIVKQVQLNTTSKRMFTANNLVPRKELLYFMGEADQFASSSPQAIVSGCATAIPTSGYPTIYRIESVLQP